MKFKVVRRPARGAYEEGTEPDVYDIYIGVSGFPVTLPFCTKWHIEKSALTILEALQYIGEYVLETNTKIIIKECY